MGEDFNVDTLLYSNGELQADLSRAIGATIDTHGISITSAVPHYIDDEPHIWYEPPEPITLKHVIDDEGVKLLKEDVQKLKNKLFDFEMKLESNEKDPSKLYKDIKEIKNKIDNMYDFLKWSI